MLKKIISLAAALGLIVSALSIIGGAPASASGLSWTSNPINSTGDLQFLNGSKISGDGKVKVVGSNLDVYVSRYTTSWSSFQKATLPASLSYSYIAGFAVDQTGENIVAYVNPMSNGDSAEVFVSSDFGATFALKATWSGANDHYIHSASVTPDGRTIALGGYETATYSTNGMSSGARFLSVSNDSGATWATLDLDTTNDDVNVFAVGTATSGTNRVFARYNFGILKQFDFVSGDASSSISIGLESVVGADLSAISALGDLGRIAISSDGTKAISISYSASTFRKFVIGSDAKWTVSTLTPTFGSTTPTTLTGSNSTNVDAVYISNDGLSLGFTFSVFQNAPPFSNSGYLFSSTDGGTNIPNPLDSISTSFSGRPSVSDSGSIVFLLGRTSTLISTDHGASFTTQSVSVTSSLRVNSVVASSDGQVLGIVGQSMPNSPPGFFFSFNGGATTSSVTLPSSTYSNSVFIKPDSSKAIAQLTNYMTQVSVLKLYSGSSFATESTISLPVGVTKIGRVSVSADFTMIAVTDVTTAMAGKIYVGAIAPDGSVFWDSSSYGATTVYTNMVITPQALVAIGGTSFYRAPITSGVVGSVTTTAGATVFSGGISGAWSNYSSSLDGAKIVVSGLGTSYSPPSSWCYGGGYSYLSTDAGLTWTTIPTGASQAQFGTPAISPDGAYIGVGLAGGKLKISSDGGTSFVDQDSLGTLTCDSSHTNWTAPYFFGTSSSTNGIIGVDVNSTINLVSLAGSSPSESPSASPSESPSASPSATSSATTDAQEEMRQAEIKVAKTAVVEVLKSLKPLSITQLAAADIVVASEKALDRVNAKVRALPEENRTDLDVIQKIVKTENFVDKVSTPTTQRTVTTLELVQEGLVEASYKFKTTVLQTLIKKDAKSLDSIEKVQAAVKDALASIAAKKDRLVAIKKKIAGYSSSK